MDTPSRSSRTPLLPRWLRVSILFSLILLVQGALAYLLTWYDPPRALVLVSIRINSYPAWTAPHDDPGELSGAIAAGTTRAEIQQALDNLSTCNAAQPVVVYLSGMALQIETGDVVIVPADGTPVDAASWLPLAEVLAKLKACPSRQKLLVFEWMPPPSVDRLGYVHQDIAAALPRELAAVADDHRLVLSACAAGQQPLHSAELGQSVFGHYFHQALNGHADGHADARDGRVTAAELTAFLQARVERWALHNRGERQTPTLHGTMGDFTIATVVDRPGESPRKRVPQEFTAEVWRKREALTRSGEFRLNPRGFQRLIAELYDAEQGPRALLRPTKGPPRGFAERIEFTDGVPGDAGLNAARKTLDEQWRILEQQLATAKPADAERLKKRFVEDMRARAAHGDHAVFAHVLGNPRLDPGTLRLFDQLLHPTPTTAPRTPHGLRLRQLADLAMRVEVRAWPRDLVEVLLRATDAGERALQQTPHLPGYDTLLAEPTALRHAGEIRVWTRGYADPEEARRMLTTAHEQTDRLLKLNERWDKCALLLDETLAELPWYLEALETLSELREPWQQAASSARALADTLGQKLDDTGTWSARVDRLAMQVALAEKEAERLRQRRQALHVPFAKDVLARLERQCRSAHADAVVLQQARALLSVPAPVLRADDRVALARAVQTLSHRLNDESLALDVQDQETQRTAPVANKTQPIDDEVRRAALRASWHLALLDLAGLPEDRLARLRRIVERSSKDSAGVDWCEVGGIIRDLTYKQMAQHWQQATGWREQERLAWLMPPSACGELRPAESPTIKHLRQQKQQRDRIVASDQMHRAHDYAGVGFDSPGIVAARAFYASKNHLEAPIRLGVVRPVAPLTDRQPYADIEIEVTRMVPAGAFGPVELRFHRPDDVWLEMAPDHVTLPALDHAREPRTLTHRVPLRVARQAKAERSGLPPPLGFLVEARFEGRSYHRVVTAPIVPSTQELQILVSADPDEPANTLDEIRVRPGKVKQPHFVYVKNLTNRPQRFHVEVKAGVDVLHATQKVQTLPPDGIRKVAFEEAAGARELRGPLAVRVLDADRQKLLAERSLRVAVLAPHEYVKIAQASYESGGEGAKWAVQVHASKAVAGPAIAAQLVLPVQRIPGLIGVSGGTLKVELPTHSKAPRTLFAEGLKLVKGADEEGPVYLHIDGVPRAFIYRTTFSRSGPAAQPLPDDRPAVRLVAPPYAMAGIQCFVDVEVDNAPPGCKLDVALGRSPDGKTFKPEVVREFTEAKKHRIDLEATKDALVFDAAIGDWTATFDTRSVVGPRELRARLIDVAGKEIASARQSLVIDDSPPIARIVATPAQVKKGTALQVQAQGVDPESGVAQVVYFYGKPDKGEIPPAAPRFKAVPANRENTQWSATLQLPADHKGPLVISVQVVNHAGLAAIDTVTIDVTDREPGKTGLGEIRGKVVEGPRPQPGLTVTLLDERGKEVARTKTQPDGTYVFTGLVPGRYRVVCIKPESQRRAVLGITVEPDRMSQANLALML